MKRSIRFLNPSRWIARIIFISDLSFGTFTILLCLVMLILSSCGTSNPIQDEAEIITPELMQTDQKIWVGLSERPGSLDPAYHLSDTSEIILRNIFDSLLTRDHGSNVHLELAESIRLPDDRTLLIKLREGVLFHDGVELTSRDVVYTFNRIIQENALQYPEPHTSPKKTLAAPIESIEAKDRYTVIMHLTDPWPAAYQLLVQQQIVPMHYLELVGDQGFQKHPIGSGPFKFITADEDKGQVVLQKFADYYGGALTLEPVGPACIDEVVFIVTPDPRLRMAALAVGKLDLIQRIPLPLPPEIADNPEIQVKEVPGTHPIWLEMNVTKEPFNDLRVRLALNYALDKQELSNEIFQGRAVVLAGPLSPYNEFVSRDLESYPYDPDLTKQLFARSGWIDLSGQGLQRPEGDIFQMTIDTTLELEPLAKALADQYRAIGIRVSVRTWEPDVIQELMQKGERDAFLGDWGDPTFDPIGHFELKWHGKVEGERYGSANFSGYNNTRVNDLIRNAEITLDPTERYALYNEAQHIIYQEAPAVFLLLPQSIEAATVDLENWAPAADGSIDLHDVCISSQ
jgi:peptide/nickel transport system substrate-binding protein